MHSGKTKRQVDHYTWQPPRYFNNGTQRSAPADFLRLSLIRKLRTTAQPNPPVNC